MDDQTNEAKKGIELTAQETLIAWIALTLTDKTDQAGRPQGKTYPLGQLPVASGAIGKIRAASETNSDQIKFKEKALIDFSTDEKKLIKDNLGFREWSAGDGEAVLSLQKKLE